MSAPTTYTEYALHLATDPQSRKDRMLGEYTRKAVELDDLASIPSAMRMIDKAVDDVELVNKYNQIPRSNGPIESE